MFLWGESIFDTHYQEFRNNTAYFMELIVLNIFTTSFFQGPTERRWLDNIEEIVESSLPVHKVKEHFNSVAGSASSYIMQNFKFAKRQAKVNIIL